MLPVVATVTTIGIRAVSLNAPRHFAIAGRVTIQAQYLPRMAFPRLTDIALKRLALLELGRDKLMALGTVTLHAEPRFHLVLLARLGMPPGHDVPDCRHTLAKPRRTHLLLGLVTLALFFIEALPFLLMRGLHILFALM